MESSQEYMHHIVALKLKGTNQGELMWKKYEDIDKILTQARKRCGMNYYIGPAAKEYIQNHKKSQFRNTRHTN